MKNLKIIKKGSRTLITNSIRLSYPHLFKKPIFKGVECEYYSTQILIEKDNKELIKNIIEIQKEIFEEEKQDKFKGKKTLKDLTYSVLKDGSDYLENNPEFEGYYVMKCKNKKTIKVVDIHKDPVTEEDNLVYGGAYARVGIRFTPYNYMNQTGFNVTLLLVQMLGGGAAFSDILSVDDLTEIEQQPLLDGDLDEIV